MSLYPSLEDMKVDRMIKAQLLADQHYIPHPPQVPQNPLPQVASCPSAPEHHILYPALGDYMGLELSEDVIAANMPEYAVVNRQSTALAPQAPSTGSLSGMIAPLSGNSLGLQRAHVTNGIRELTLCKDKDGKIGMRVHSVNNGVFVCLVSPNSPASMAGLRFGDQVLEINGVTVAGYSMDQAHKLLRKAPNNGIKVIVRDRPFERTITLHKDSVGHIGFQFKNGKITTLVKDSSAARNGLLTDHQLLEVNGKNVIGLKDKEIGAEIENGGDIITITIIPSYIYEHMIKKMSGSLLKSGMDHSIPTA
ncbi:syntenin-1 [Neodiprion pinetum]|uniref:syntenin-1 n=1 Tax=Neodiprion pinetum TaxID=441929 RepID=UPI001EDEEC0C|nr:syntenin-1-like [Neodiprion pinetum]XP_046468331.1 syntenin-1-like [Neodiprion pinetum]XP_046468332.1 syntenin-1-like [Neodiprion pinetum]